MQVRKLTVRTRHETTGCLGYLQSNRKEKLINLILILNVISKLLLHDSFELYTSCSVWLCITVNTSLGDWLYFHITSCFVDLKIHVNELIS